MNKEQLKKLIKPLVKECVKESIHEVLFNSGIVTKVVAEVIKGVNIPNLVESMSKPAPLLSQASVPKTPTTREEMEVRAFSKSTSNKEMQAPHIKEIQDKRTRIEEQMQGTLGINIFENTSAAPAPSQGSGQGVLEGVAANDPGVNLNNIPGLHSTSFKNHLKKQ